MKAKKIMKLFYWYYCNSIPAWWKVNPDKIKEVDKLIKQFEDEYR